MAKKENYEIDIRIAGMMDNSLPKAIQKAQKQLESAKKSFSQQMNDIEPIFDGLDNFLSNSFEAIASAVENVASKAYEGLKTVADVGMAFEKQMSAVKAVSQGTADEMELITDRARELGRNTVYTSQEIGTAMETLALSGWEASQIYDGIAGVISLASASGEDLNSMASIMTDTLHSFNMEASKSDDVANVLAATAMSSNTNVLELGEALKYIGPVAGSLGYQFEDVALMMGLFANQGIKASQAGTSLRNVMSNLYKGIKVGEKEIAVRGEDGQQRSLFDIIADVRTAFNELDSVEKGEQAFEIGGMRGSTALLALANASDEQIASLQQNILNASAVGTAEQAAKTRLDNLSGDIELFNDALADVGLTIYDDVGSPIRTVVQWATDLINTLNTKIENGSLFDGIKKVINSKTMKSLRNFVDGIYKKVVGLKEPLINILEGVASHLPEIVGCITTLVAAAKIFKGLKVAMEVIALLKIFSATPVAIGIMAVSVAIGAVTTALLKFNQSAKEEVMSNLADHFGDIQLSASQTSEAVKAMIGDDMVDSLNSYSKAVQTVDDSMFALSESSDDLDTLNWQLKLGVKFDDEKVGDYQTAISDFVEKANQYVIDKRIAVNIAANLTWGENSTEGQLIDNAFNVYSFEIESLGKQMSDEFNKAFVDGVFDVDLLDSEKIAKLQSQIAEITNLLADAEFKAKMEVIKKQGGSALTFESFSALMGQYSEQTGAMAQTKQEALTTALAATNLSQYYQNNPTEKAEAENTAWAKYYGDMLSAYSTQWNFGLETLQGSNYGGMIETGSEQLQNSITKIIGNIFSSFANDTASLANINEMLSSATQMITGGLSKTEIDQLNEILATFEPMIAQMVELENGLKSTDTSSFTPEQLAEYNAQLEQTRNIIQSFTEMKALTGDRTALSEVIGYAIGNNEEWAKVANEAHENGLIIPQEIYNGILETTPTKAAEASQQVAETYKEDVATAMGNEFSNPIDVVLNINWTSAVDNWGSFVSNYVGQKKSSLDMAFGGLGAFTIPQNVEKHANGGIVTEPILTTFAENGAEAAIPLDGSARSVSLWQKTGNILSSKGANVSGSSIVYSPNITINGNANPSDILSATRQAQSEFDTFMKNWIKQNRRVSFA